MWTLCPLPPSTEASVYIYTPIFFGARISNVCETRIELRSPSGIRLAGCHPTRPYTREDRCPTTYGGALFLSLYTSIFVVTGRPGERPRITRPNTCALMCPTSQVPCRASLYITYAVTPLVRCRINPHQNVPLHTRGVPPPGSRHQHVRLTKIFRLGSRLGDAGPPLVNPMQVPQWAYSLPSGMAPGT
jgi:hypothetical protein